MARNKAFEKGSTDEIGVIGVTCATDITDTRVAMRFADDSNEVAVVCGDNERCVGFPDRKAKAGEAFNLRRVGTFFGIADGSDFATVNNKPWTTAANGKIRLAVFGTDLIQGFTASTAVANATVSVDKQFS